MRKWVKARRNQGLFDKRRYEPRPRGVVKMMLGSRSIYRRVMSF